MADEKKPFVPFTTEEKKEFGKQFSTKEKTSYRKGQRSAYSHMANTAKRQSVFISDNIRKDETIPFNDKPVTSKVSGIKPLETKAAQSKKAEPLTPTKTTTTIQDGKAFLTKIYEPPKKGK